MNRMGDYQVPRPDPPRPEDIPTAEQIRQEREIWLVSVGCILIVLGCAMLAWIFGR